jgi:hypothetical protein
VSAPVNSPDIPNDVICISENLCDPRDDSCVENCAYLYPEECFNAQTADAVDASVLAINPPNCELPNFVGSNSDCDISKDFSNNNCRYASVDEDRILEDVDDYEELDIAIQLVFGDKASVGFVCSITESNVTDSRPLPGRCCLDAPYSKTNESLWGQPVRTEALSVHVRPYFLHLNQNFLPLFTVCLQ